MDIASPFGQLHIDMLVHYLRMRHAKQLLDRLEQRQTVSSDDLAYVLGSERWKQLMMAIGEVQQQRSLQRAVPAYLISATKRYTEKLALADRLEMRANKTKPAFISTPVTRWKMLTKQLRSGVRGQQNHRKRAELAYESAIEILQEVIEEFPEVIQHLDRHAVFEGDAYNVTPDPAGVPRMRRSRSRYAQSQPTHKQSIKCLKIEAIIEFIEHMKQQQLNNY